MSEPKSARVENEWEIVREARDKIRRTRVPGGWLYQVQMSLRYNSAPGTIGRQDDPGQPTWWQPVFVPDGLGC